VLSKRGAHAVSTARVCLGFGFSWTSPDEDALSGPSGAAVATSAQDRALPKSRQLRGLAAAVHGACKAGIERFAGGRWCRGGKRTDVTAQSVEKGEWKGTKVRRVERVRGR
jgi:hypothetical protein